MQIHDTRQDRINLVHNNKRYGLTKIDEVVLFLLISSFYFRGTKHICMYNQNSYCLAAVVVEVNGWPFSTSCSRGRWLGGALLFAALLQ